MKLPFKKGDIVRFVVPSEIIKDIDFNISYTVVSCQVDAGYGSGYKVSIDQQGVTYSIWDSSWFELDKKSIIKAILEDL